MRLTVYAYPTIEDRSGLSLRTIKRERFADGAVRDAMDELLEDWIDGKVDPVRIVQRSTSNPEDRVTIERVEKREGSLRTYSSKEVPLQKRHVLTAALRMRGLGVETHDGEGNPVEPIVRVVLHDATRFDLPWPYGDPDEMNQAAADETGSGGENGEEGSGDSAPEKTPANKRTPKKTPAKKTRA